MIKKNYKGCQNVSVGAGAGTVIRIYAERNIYGFATLSMTFMSSCSPDFWWAPPPSSPSFAWDGPTPSHGVPASGGVAGRTGPDPTKSHSLLYRQRIFVLFPSYTTINTVTTQNIGLNWILSKFLIPVFFLLSTVKLKNKTEMYR